MTCTWQVVKAIFFNFPFSLGLLRVLQWAFVFLSGQEEGKPFLNRLHTMTKLGAIHYSTGHIIK